MFEETVQLKDLYPPESKIILLTGLTKENHSAIIRLRSTSKEEFLQWLKEHETLSNVTFRVVRTLPRNGNKVDYKAVFGCQHNTHPTHHKVKNPSKKHTGCRTRLTVTIKSNPKGRKNRSKDILREDYPTLIDISHEHNHPIDAEEALKYRDPSDQVKEKFLEMFKSHHTPARALLFHKQDLQQEYEDEFDKISADRSLCPDAQWVYRLYYKTYKDEFAELTSAEGKKYRRWVRNKAAIKKCETDIVEDVVKTCHDRGIRAKYSFFGEDFVISLCTPLMERAHSLETAGNIVFCDSSGNIDRCKCCVFLLMCDSKVGGLPLGIIVSSSDTEYLVTEGLKLLKDIIPDTAFGSSSNKSPDTFVSNDCAALQKSLKTVFPSVKTLLCPHYLLQAAWKWLFEKSHEIEQLDRLELYNLFKDIVFSQNEEQYIEYVNKFFDNPTTTKYNHFRTYTFDQLKYVEKWSHCFWDVEKENKTHNYVESAMRVLRDKVLSRTRAFNLKQLVNFLSVFLADVYWNKILEVITNRHQSLMFMRHIPNAMNLEHLQVLDMQDGICLVENEENNMIFQINTELGVCSCPVGVKGAPCTHQHVVAVHLEETCSNVEPMTDDEKNMYFWIATGKQDMGVNWDDPLIIDNVSDDSDDMQMLCEQTIKIEKSPYSNSSCDEADTYVENSFEEFDEEFFFLKDLDELSKMLKEGFKKNPVGYSEALRKFNATLKSNRTDSLKLSVLNNAGKSNFPATIIKSEEQETIPVQPTSTVTQILCDLCGNILK